MRMAEKKDKREKPVEPHLGEWVNHGTKRVQKQNTTNLLAWGGRCFSTM